MRKIAIIFLFFIFAVSSLLFARESEVELKTYLSDMNKIVIRVEEAIRNLSMKILPAKNVAEQMEIAIEKFEALKPPSMFSKDHQDMLSAFKDLRDGFKLLSDRERDRSVGLVKKGAAIFKKAAISIKTTAEKEGLIPQRPISREAVKPILPSQTPSIIAGTSPTPSPHISSPGIKRESMTSAEDVSTDFSLDDISDFQVIPQVPSTGISMLGQAASPIMFIATGNIASIESRGDNFVVGLNDFSGNSLSFEFDSKTSRVIKDNKAIDITALDIGKPSYVFYTKKDDVNKVVFISILKPEDADALKKKTESAPLR